MHLQSVSCFYYQLLCSSTTTSYFNSCWHFCQNGELLKSIFISFISFGFDFRDGITATPMMSRIQPLFRALALPRDNRQSMRFHSTDTLCHTHIQYIRERGLYHALPSPKFTNDNIYYSICTVCPSSSTKWHSMKFGCFLDHDLSQDQRQADHITRNTAMACCAWHLARQLLDDAVDLVGFNTAPRFKAAAKIRWPFWMLWCCHSSGCWCWFVSYIFCERFIEGPLKEFHRVLLKRYVWLSEYVCNSLFSCQTEVISTCEKACQWQLALALLQLIEVKSLQPDVISYSTAISACSGGHFKAFGSVSILLMGSLERCWGVFCESITTPVVKLSAPILPTFKSLWGFWIRVKNIVWTCVNFIWRLANRVDVSSLVPKIVFPSSTSLIVSTKLSGERGQQWELAIHLMKELEQARMILGTFQSQVRSI